MTKRMICNSRNRSSLKRKKRNQVKQLNLSPLRKRNLRSKNLQQLLLTLYSRLKNQSRKNRRLMKKWRTKLNKKKKKMRNLLSWEEVLKVVMEAMRVKRTNGKRKSPKRKKRRRSLNLDATSVRRNTILGMPYSLTLKRLGMPELFELPKHFF